jgi:hypothetical protein
MARALSIEQLRNKRFKTMSFEQQWQALTGSPERTGSWLIYGDSGMGKTTFTCMLAKYFSNFDRVLYNSLEEGASLSMQRAFELVQMHEAVNSVVLLDSESIEELSERLRRPKSPSIIFVDSLDYTGINYKQYREIKAEFKSKLFIFTAHGSGKIPDSHLAQRVRFDANVKIKVYGFMAYAKSRYGGGEPFTIWEEGAKEFHGIKNHNNESYKI